MACLLFAILLELIGWPAHGCLQVCSLVPDEWAVSVPFRLWQAELDNGAAIAALRRFNDNLAALPADSWGAQPACGGSSRGCSAPAELARRLPVAAHVGCCCRRQHVPGHLLTGAAAPLLPLQRPSCAR